MSSTCSYAGLSRRTIPCVFTLVFPSDSSKKKSEASPASEPAKESASEQRTPGVRKRVLRRQVIGMAFEILLKLDRFVAPGVRALDTIVESLKDVAAKFEVVSDTLKG